MISVQNHRLLLSGNKWLPFFCIALLLAACSPKTRPVATTVKKTTDTEKKPGNITEKPSGKVSEQKVANIAMILPLNLEHLNPAQKYSPVQLSQANIAVEYYQGFKLALDSLTAYGNNYKLQIFDSR